jgi:hypothetical protein
LLIRGLREGTSTAKREGCRRGKDTPNKPPSSRGLSAAAFYIVVHKLLLQA